MGIYRTLASQALNFMYKMKQQGSRRSGKTWKTREKLGKFRKLGKPGKSERSFLKKILKLRENSGTF